MSSEPTAEDVVSFARSHLGIELAWWQVAIVRQHFPDAAVAAIGHNDPPGRSGSDPAASTTKGVVRMVQYPDEPSGDPIEDLIEFGLINGVGITFEPWRDGHVKVGYMMGMGGGDLVTGPTLLAACEAAMPHVEEMIERRSRR